MAQFSFSYTNETSITVVHSLNDLNVFWVLYDSDGVGFFPDPNSPTVVDANTLTFDFGTNPVTGTGQILSILDIVPGAQATSFTTIQSVKNWLNMTTSGSETQIAVSIASITVEMQNYMDRLIVQTTVSGERHNGNAQTSILLNQFPVTVTGSNSPVVIEDDVVIDADDYFVNGDTGVIQLKSTRFSSSAWPKITVDYESGFLAGVPADINQAAVKQVAYEWRLQGDREDLSLASSTVVGVLVDTYRTARFAQGVQEVLDRYREARP